VARDFDVVSYLEGAQHTKVVQFEVPAKLTTQDAKGATTPLPAPAELDWWVAKASGPGSQSIAWPIADGPYDVVVMNADGKPAPDAQVTLGVELDGAFLTCLLVLLGGLLLLAGGILLMFGRRSRPAAPQPDNVVPAPAPFPGYGPPRQDAPSGYSPVRRTAGVVATASVMLAATGCVAVPKENTVDTLSRPAVSAEAGRAVVKRYNEVNNKANSRRDYSLIGSVEGEPVLTQSRAGYRIGRALKMDTFKPFSFTQPLLGAPDYSTYPMRFVVSSGTSANPKSRHLGVWERRSAGAAWTLTHSVYPPTGMKLPNVAGLRVPSKADLAGLVAPPKTVATDLAQYLTGGSSSPKAASFVPSPGTTNLLKSRVTDKKNDLKDDYITSVSDTFKVRGEPVSFMTLSGEGLVFLALTEQYLQRIRPGNTAHWARGDVTAFSKGVDYSRALTYDVLHQFAVVVPPKGKGKVRILSIDGQLVDAGGY
jgi:hypothetical protein